MEYAIMARKNNFKAKFPGRPKALMRTSHELVEPDFDLDLTKPLSTDSDKDSDLSWDDCYEDDGVGGDDNGGDDQGDIILIVDEVANSPTNRKERRTAKAKQAKLENATKRSMGVRVDDPVEVQPPRSLPECHSEADILDMRWEHSGVFTAKGIAALDKKTVRAALGAMYDDCVLAVTGEGTDIATAANHRARTDAYEHAGRGALALLNANPSWQIVAATIVVGDSPTSSDKTVVDVRKEIAIGREFGKKVTPHFFGVVELAHFNSHKHEKGGRIIHPHSQMLLFGDNIFEKAEKVAKEYGATLPKNFTDAPQIVVQLVDPDPLNVMKVASYLFKPPHKAKTWCPPRDGKRGHMHHSEKGDRAIIYLRMAIILSMLPLDRIIFAGGDCKTIKSGVVSDVRSNRKSACKNPNRMLAPDTIGSFWVEVIRVLKRKKWWLPVIVF